MSRSNAIVLLLLACALLSTTVGIVHAEACDSATSICLSTDKVIYSPGDSVYVTVRLPTEGSDCYNNGYPYCSSDIWSVQVEMVPVPWGPATFPLEVETVSLSMDNNWVSTASFGLATNMTAGHYDIGVVAYSVTIDGYKQFTSPISGTLNPVVDITVTNTTPVPESPSVLGLLLPGLIVGIYAMKKRLALMGH
jgi:hypothetical protein